MLTTLTLLALAAQSTPQSTAPAPIEVHYTVEARDARGSDGVIPIHVTIDWANPPERLVVAMPVWTPGSYRLRDFPDRVSEIEASADDGNTLEVERLDRETWQVHTRGSKTSLRYRVALAENDRFMMRGNRRRCITYEGPGVYMYARGFERTPRTVRFEIPDDWSVACGLESSADGNWLAPDYDFLADCPVKLGVFQRWSFESWGKQIDVVVDGPGDIDFEADEWLENIRKIADCQGEMFGGLPFERYVFLYTASPRGGGGGLEHLTSTTIGVSANALRRTADAGIGTTAHELFHAWNVKRIRPIELGPFDYSRPNRTTALWFMEGVTSYYTQVTLARCGLKDERAFWTAMGSQIRALESNPAREHVSSADASRTVWEPSASDRSLNYYNSGLVLGLLLDVEIRARSGNRKSLDDLMRRLFEHCTTLGRGFEEHELADLASEVAGSDLREFFDRYVDGTRVPDYRAMLARAAVDCVIEITREKELRGARSASDESGPYWLDPDARSSRAILRGQGKIVAIDGQPVATLEGLEAIVADLEVGARPRLDLEGPFGRRRVRAEIVSTPRAAVRIELLEAAPAEAIAILKGITGAR